jgi:hypothetical protein
MKYLTILILLSLLSGCASGWNTDVSNEPPYNQLVKTQWKMKTDAYIVEYQDQRRVYIISPCKSPFWVAFPPDWKREYNENNIGNSVNGEKVVGGLRTGEILEIVSVVKNSHIEMGKSYHPMMIPNQTNAWTKSKVLDGAAFYRYSDDKSMLDTNYVVRIK